MTEAELVQIEQRAAEARTWREKWHSSGYHQGALSLQAVYGASEWSEDAVALVAEVRRLQGVVAVLEQEAVESSRVPMPWTTPPVDPAQVQAFLDHVWNKAR